jgi:hypothetical protein
MPAVTELTYCTALATCTTTHVYMYMYYSAATLFTCEHGRLTRCNHCQPHHAYDHAATPVLHIVSMAGDVPLQTLLGVLLCCAWLKRLQQCATPQHIYHCLQVAQYQPHSVRPPVSMAICPRNHTPHHHACCSSIDRKLHKSTCSRVQPLSGV